MSKMFLLFSLLKHFFPSLWKGLKSHVCQVENPLSFCECRIVTTVQDLNFFTFAKNVTSCLFLIPNSLSRLNVRLSMKPEGNRFALSSILFLPLLCKLSIPLCYNLCDSVEQFLFVLPSNERKIFWACDGTFISELTCKHKHKTMTTLASILPMKNTATDLRK